MKRKNTEREYIAAHGKLSKGKRSFIYAWKCVRMFYLYSMGISNPLNNTSNSIHFLIVTFYIIHWGFNNFDQYFISDCMSLPTCSHARNDIGECCGIKNYWIYEQNWWISWHTTIIVLLLIYFMILLSILLRLLLSASYFELYHKDYAGFFFKIL